MVHARPKSVRIREQQRQSLNLQLPNAARVAAAPSSTFQLLAIAQREAIARLYYEAWSDMLVAGPVELRLE